MTLFIELPAPCLPLGESQLATTRRSVFLLISCLNEIMRENDVTRVGGDMEVGVSWNCTVGELPGRRLRKGWRGAMGDLAAGREMGEAG